MEKQRKNAAAVALNRAAVALNRARTAKLSPERRSELARKAAESRWARYRERQAQAS